jgi:hypothetical protein
MDVTINGYRILNNYSKNSPFRNELEEKMIKYNIQEYNCKFASCLTIKLCHMETKFKSKYEFPVYIIDRDEIKQMSMKEYLETYWNDDTTTPSGVANRTQVRVLEADGWTAKIKYGTFSWIEKSGKYSFVWNRDEYDSWEEAYECILDYLFYNFETKKHDAPDAYPTKKTAELVMEGERFYKEFGRYPKIMEKISKNFGKYKHV